MAVLLAVKLRHDLHVESKSNPPMNVCAGTSVGCQLSPQGYSHILSGLYNQQAAPCCLLGLQPLQLPEGCDPPLPFSHGGAALMLGL